MNRMGLRSCCARRLIVPALVVLAIVSLVAPALAAGGAGEASLRVPDLGQVTFGGVSGRALLMWGLVVCALGLGFGVVIFAQLKNLPVHGSMREISELIYETCKSYLITQGKFLLLLETFIGVIIVLYFGALLKYDALKVVIILAFSRIGIGGSYGVAWFGMRINTFANSRTAFASLEGKPFPVYAIPLKAGMSVGMLLISVELFLMLCILLFIPGDYAGPCFIGFAIGESLGAAALRIAGGIFTKIADIGSDLMKIVFNIKEDDARNPGVIADCTGDNAGDSVGPSADGFETYGVTGVALLLIPDLGDGTLWWKLGLIITCGTLAGAIIPELVKVFTSVDSSHVKEVVTASKEGGASLNILAGFVAGNFSAYWLGLSIVSLMGIAAFVGTSTPSLGALMLAPAVFAFGLVAFGFLGMGPVTIAVDSYGPVTDNAQSVFELSVIEHQPNIVEELKRDHNVTVVFTRAKHLLEENDGAGNTFKATANL